MSGFYSIPNRIDLNFLYGFSKHEMAVAWLNKNGTTSKMTNWPALIRHAACIHVCQLLPKIVGLFWSNAQLRRNVRNGVTRRLWREAKQIQKQVRLHSIINIGTKRCSAVRD